MDGQETIVNPLKHPQRQFAMPTLVKTEAPAL